MDRTKVSMNSPVPEMAIRETTRAGSGQGRGEPRIYSDGAGDICVGAGQFLRQNRFNLKALGRNDKKLSRAC